MTMFRVFFDHADGTIDNRLVKAGSAREASDYIKARWLGATVTMVTTGEIIVYRRKRKNKEASR